jgi:hypothetical protein
MELTMENDQERRIFMATEKKIIKKSKKEYYVL